MGTRANPLFLFATFVASGLVVLVACAPLASRFAYADDGSLEPDTSPFDDGIGTDSFLSEGGQEDTAVIGPALPDGGSAVPLPVDTAAQGCTCSMMDSERGTGTHAHGGLLVVAGALSIGALRRRRRAQSRPTTSR